MTDLVAIIKRMRAKGAIDEYIANVLFEDLDCCHFEIELAMKEANETNKKALWRRIHRANN